MIDDVYIYLMLANAMMLIVLGLLFYFFLWCHLSRYLVIVLKI